MIYDQLITYTDCTFIGVASFHMVRAEGSHVIC